MTFLGTGGGRFATITQARATGGLYLQGEVSIHIDPGPGALVHMHRAGLDPRDTEAILISHGHPDHYVDAPVLLEALNPRGDKPQGVLAGSVSALEGQDEDPPPIHPFHQSRAAKRQVLEAGSKLLLGPTVVEATPSFHSDPTTIGFKIHTNEGIISYLADTAFDEALVKAHRGARVLVLPTTTPNQDRIRGHLCTEDSQALVEALQPEITLLNHFGLRMIRKEPEVQAQKIERATGIRTLAAQDMMGIMVGDELVATPSSLDELVNAPDPAMTKDTNLTTPA